MSANRGRNTLAGLLLVAAFLAAAVVPGRAASQAVARPGRPVLLAGSTFDADDEGWRLHRSGPVRHAATGGAQTNGGYIFGEPPTGIVADAWIAPNGFLGEKSAAFLGLLIYHAQVDRSPNADMAVVLKDDTGYVIAYRGSPAVRLDANGWAEFAVPLDPAAPGWTAEGTSSPPNADRMMWILTGLGQLAIAGFARQSIREITLDNVALIGPPPSPLKLAVQPTRINFGTVNVNFVGGDHYRGTKTFRVYNRGRGPLPIGAEYRPAGSVFPLTSWGTIWPRGTREYPVWTVPPGEYIEYIVGFDPPRAGAYRERRAFRIGYPPNTVTQYYTITATAESETD